METCSELCCATAQAKSFVLNLEYAASLTIEIDPSSIVNLRSDPFQYRPAKKSMQMFDDLQLSNFNDDQFGKKMLHRVSCIREAIQYYLGLNQQRIRDVKVHFKKLNLTDDLQLGGIDKMKFAWFKWVNHDAKKLFEYDTKPYLLFKTFFPAAHNCLAFLLYGERQTISKNDWEAMSTVDDPRKTMYLIDAANEIEIAEKKMYETQNFIQVRWMEIEPSKIGKQTTTYTTDKVPTLNVPVRSHLRNLKYGDSIYFAPTSSSKPRAFQALRPNERDEEIMDAVMLVLADATIKLSKMLLHTFDIFAYIPNDTRISFRLINGWKLSPGFEVKLDSNFTKNIKTT